MRRWSKGWISSALAENHAAKQTGQSGNASLFSHTLILTQQQDQASDFLGRVGVPWLVWCCLITMVSSAVLIAVQRVGITN